MTRPKPKTDEDKIAWCMVYDTSCHADKLKLCELYGVTYDTLRHWRTDWAGLHVLPVKAPMQKEPYLELPEELFQSKSDLKLDFTMFDLETSNLNADFSVLLCACIKPFGQKVMSFRADNYNENWAVERMDDSALVEAVSGELAKHAVIVTHFGGSGRFDIPYLRAKLNQYGLPPTPPLFSLDTYSLARANFKVSSRRLKNLARYFELGKKSDVEGSLWMEAAMNGNIKALDNIVKHCEQDVELLERLAVLSFPYLRSIRRI